MSQSVVGSAISVKVNPHRLSGAHILQLRFLRIGSHSDILSFEGNNGHQLLAGRNVLSELDGSLSYDSADRYV